MPPHAISVEDLRKVFADGTIAVDGISFEVQQGEVVSLLGPSGCGKTTTLRCIAGLEVPDAGRIGVGGREVVGPRVFFPPEGRGLSMVFQQYALWPHMTVEENVSFGLKVRRMERQVVAQRAEQALSTVQLWDQRARRIAHLSGGQQQRVALARAISFQPDVILFDEPLSNLDAKLREQMRLEIVELQRQYGFAGLYVTHDQMEAISVSDRVIIMNGGNIEQIGTPEDVWVRPATRFVARFIGETNEFRNGVVTGRGRVDLGGVEISTDADLDVGARTDVYIPYDAVELVPGGGTPGHETVAGRVDLINFQGYSTLVKVESAAGAMVLRTSSPKGLQEGADVMLRVPPSAVRCFPRGG